MSRRFAYGQNVACDGTECPAFASGVIGPDDSIYGSHADHAVGLYDDRVKEHPDVDTVSGTVDESVAQQEWLTVMEDAEDPAIERFMRRVADELGWL